jgi:protein-disulfide isomerase
MKLDRRHFIAAGGAVAAAGALAFYSFGNDQLTGMQLPGLGQANAQSGDLASLHEAPDLGERVLGEADAPVTVIEYASATCGHCASFHKDSFPALKKDYIDTGKVRFVFREFPLDELALAAFMLARCAPENRYFPIIDVLFEEQQSWTRNAREELLKIARMAGFTPESFDQCLQDEDVAKGILAIRSTAAEQYGVQSTPTFFINGEMIAGNKPDELRQAIEDAAG